VLLEALLAERPCVATAVNGVPEVLLDGVTGRTVPARDPAAMGAALVELLEHPDWARGLARAGAAHVRANFDIRATCAGYRNLYAGVFVEG
jgi:glycosyltransferase involved in cell wall biosynthesis